MGNLGVAAFCRREQCAWWINNRNECAIHTFDEIRNKLDYMLEMGEKIFYTKK